MVVGETDDRIPWLGRKGEWKCGGIGNGDVGGRFWGKPGCDMVQGGDGETEREHVSLGTAGGTKIN